MAGMFYSIEETAKKLAKNEAEIKQLVQQGKLREFRDGAKLLFKKDEVEALASAQSKESPKPTAEQPDIGDSLSLGEDSSLQGGGLEGSSFLLSEDSQLNDQDNLTVDENLELLEDTKPAEKPKPQQKTQAPLGKNGKTETKADSDFSLSLDETGELSLSSDKDAQLGMDLSELTSSDTAAKGKGINVLGDEGKDLELAADSSETKVIEPTPAKLDEKPRQKEDEVNLDSFGSGSGLLDLSLQADDTSLGAVLDNIYPESDMPGQAVVSEIPDAGEIGGGGEGEILPPAVAEPGSSEELSGAVAMPAGAVAMALEVPPDTSSNIFGLLLFIPLLAMILGTIMILAGVEYLDINLLQPFNQGMTGWYVAFAGMGLTILWAIVASFAGSTGRVAKEKPEKAAKVKPEKPKKEKPPKQPKIKEPKKEKPKKEKPAKAKK